MKRKIWIKLKWKPNKRLVSWYWAKECFFKTWGIESPNFIIREIRLELEALRNNVSDVGKLEAIENLLDIFTFLNTKANLKLWHTTVKSQSKKESSKAEWGLTNIVKEKP